MSYARPYGALGTTEIPLPKPMLGQRQPPIWPLVVGNNGSFMAVRSSPAQGACGVSGYPCKHPGVDVNGAYGTPVVAPEGGTVVQIANGASSPFGGYGPWLIVLKGDSGKYHLLGHLSPTTSGMAPVGMRVEAGQQVGTTSSANHTHWEVRKKAVPDFAHGESNATNNEDPIAWLSSQVSGVLAMVLLGGAGLLAYLMWRNHAA